MGHFERRFQRDWGIAHQPLLVSENWSDCCFVWYKNINSPSFSFVTIHVSDRRTDRQTDKLTDRISTAIPCVALHKNTMQCNRINVFMLNFFEQYFIRFYRATLY